MIDDQQGVKDNEVEASPAEDNTSEVEETQSGQTDSTETSKVSESVPYDRFAEVNSKNKRLEEEINEIRESLKELKTPKETAAPQTTDPAVAQQEALIREQLKKMGFVSKEEIQQIEEDRKLDSTMSQLEQKYSGKDGKPKFNRRDILEYARDNQIGNLEAAYKLKYQAELIDAAIKEATSKTKAVKSESSDGSGAQNAGTTNQDLIAAAKKGDRSSILSLIKRQL